MWVVVTGSSSRLGKEIALKLAKAGYHLLLHGRSKEKAQATRQECLALGVETRFIEADFSKREGVNKFVSEVIENNVPIWALVNSLGCYLPSPLSTQAMEEIDELMQLNFLAPLQVIQGLIPSLAKTKGCIVNIGSAGCGNLKAEKYSPAYMISKTALLQVTKSLAVELASQDIQVNMVSPGILENSVLPPSNPASLIPMKRFGTLEEIADVVLYLLEPKNHYITAQNIEVSGGLRA